MLTLRLLSHAHSCSERLACGRGIATSHHQGILLTGESRTWVVNLAMRGALQVHCCLSISPRGFDHSCQDQIRELVELLRFDPVTETRKSFSKGSAYARYNKANRLTAVGVCGSNRTVSNALASPFLHNFPSTHPHSPAGALYFVARTGFSCSGKDPISRVSVHTDGTDRRHIPLSFSPFFSWTFKPCHLPVQNCFNISRHCCRRILDKYQLPTFLVLTDLWFIKKG